MEDVELRRQRLEHLARKFWIAIRSDYASCQSSAEEDVMEYLTGGEDGDVVPYRWVAVTMIGGSEQDHYLKTFPTRGQAEAYSVEYVTDDIFAESPVALVDLDSDLEPWGAVYPLKKLIPVFATEPVTQAVPADWGAEA